MELNEKSKLEMRSEKQTSDQPVLPSLRLTFVLVKGDRWILYLR